MPLALRLNFSLGTKLLFCLEGIKDHYYSCTNTILPIFNALKGVGDGKVRLLVPLCLVPFLKILHTSHQRESFYLGVLNKICLQFFFAWMNCKSRDESNKPT